MDLSEVNFFTARVMLRTTDLDDVERAVDQVLLEERHVRLNARPDEASLQRSAALQPKDAPHWIVAARAYPSGWTVIESTPPWLFAHRTHEGQPRLLAKLAQRLGCDAFHLGVVDTDGDCILIEAAPDGRCVTSGFDPYEPESFRDETASDENVEAHFQIIDVPPSLQDEIGGPCDEVGPSRVLFGLAGGGALETCSDGWYYGVRLATQR